MFFTEALLEDLNNLVMFKHGAINVDTSAVYFNDVIPEYINIFVGIISIEPYSLRSWVNEGIFIKLLKSLVWDSIVFGSDFDGVLANNDLSLVFLECLGWHAKVISIMVELNSVFLSYVVLVFLLEEGDVVSRIFVDGSIIKLVCDYASMNSSVIPGVSSSYVVSICLLFYEELCNDPYFYFL